MESSTAVPVHERATGSSTIADLIGLAAERHGEQPAVRYKRDGAWHDVSYAELGEIVSEVGRGLIDLGIEPGDRVAILCTTRPEWTYADFGITASRRRRRSRSTRRTRPRSAQWVAGNSESRAIVCEDADAGREDPQGPRRPAGARDDHRHRPDRATSATRSRSTTLRERGRGRDAAELERAHRRPSRATSRTRSSTRRARPGRRRAACSATATTATSSRCASRTRSCRRATSPTCSSRSRTRSRC